MGYIRANFVQLYSIQYKLSKECVIYLTLHPRLWPAKAEDMYFGAALSLFAVNTWLLPYSNFGPNGPSWTICTLSFWYWCFPFILPRMQRLTDKQLGHGIVKYFWLRVGLALLLIIGLGGFKGDKVSCYFYEISMCS